MLTGDERSITDLAKRAGLAYPTVHREVARLLDSGIRHRHRLIANAMWEPLARGTSCTVNRAQPETRVIVPFRV